MAPSLCYAYFLLFIITTLSISSTSTSAAQDAVRDATGNKVLNDVGYHVGPVNMANGDGIKLTNTINNKKICPFDVVQDASVVISDTFMFSLIDSTRPKYLLKSRILGILSAYINNPCEKSWFWTINDAAGKAPDNLITTGGAFEDAETCFQVVDYPKPTNPKVASYMLQHCPAFCGGGPPFVCYNVTSYVDKGVKRFASTGGAPFEFVFYNVTK